jgi:hypothetical protein
MSAQAKCQGAVQNPPTGYESAGRQLLQLLNQPSSHSSHEISGQQHVWERSAQRSVAATPRLSQAGMPSQSEGWGGLFKDEQYRLIRSASRPL